MLHTKSLLIFLLLSISIIALSQEDEDKEKSISISFGVYQTDKPTEMYKKFIPIIEYIQNDLEKKINKPVDIHFSIFNSYDEARKALIQGNIDFVRFGPASYILASEKNQNIKLIAMEHKKEEKRFKGVFVVAKDSPIKELKDLKEKRFAFGS